MWFIPKKGGAPEGIVKNRRKNGDYVRRANGTDGARKTRRLMSICTRATDEEIAAVSAASVERRRPVRIHKACGVKDGENCSSLRFDGGRGVMTDVYLTGHAWFVALQ